MDGLEAARRIRALPGGDAVLLVAVTGLAREGDRAASMQAGFDHHLVKPIDVAELERLFADAGQRA